ncbi:MAG: hypothetical protein KA754_02025 [Corallincola sp.]|nr:hypothetical protein [Corallincola sp.]
MAKFNDTITRLSGIAAALLLAAGCTVTDTADNGEWTMPDEPTATGELPPPSGAILWEFYNGFPDGLIDEVRAAGAFFDTRPERTYLMSTLDLPRSIYDNFTMRLRGYLRPAVSGTYRIYVRGTMAGGVWLSADESPANAKLIAKFDKTTPVGSWDGFASQKSEPIYLEGGKSYYFEALQKNATGSDYFMVGWAAADAPVTDIKVIRGNELAPYFEKPSIDPAILAENYAVGYRVGYTDGRYGFPVDQKYPMKDSDGDGLPDNWEVAVGLDPNNDADALLDQDGDGLYALLEFQSLADPRKLDTDGDGIPDGWEVTNGLSPLDAADALTLTATGVTYLAMYRTEAGLPPPLKPGEVLVQWKAPSAREDGTELAEKDIAGFEVRYGSTLEAMTKTLRVENGSATFVVISGLDPGVIYASVLAYDTTGRLSSPSEPATLRVAE